MTLQVRKATFGAELEIGDIDTRVEIPEGNHWCRKDATICNGNGTSNDPLKRLNLFGSEIQTRPGRTPEELLEITLQIYRFFPKLEFNYTTNLHVHIRVPGLRDDLKALKKIARYQRKFGLRMFHLIDPIEPPSNKTSSLEEDRGAMKRYRRRLVSHWHQVPEYQYSLMEAAQTVDEFFLAHRKTARGLDLLPSRVTRAGVNLLQLLAPSETVEFRCFTMSRDSRKLLSAFRWPLLYINAALFTDASPEEILKDNEDLQFQHVYPYRYNLDWIFQLTNLRHNSRPQVKANYEDLIERGVLTRKELGWQ